MPDEHAAPPESITNQTAAFVTAGPCVSKVHLCLHILSSAEPELIKNAQDRERESAQHKDNFFGAVVPDDRCVVHDFGIATKQLIAPPVDENASAHGKKQRNRESDAERGFTVGLDGEKKSERVHVDVTRWREARLRTGRTVSWLGFILFCVSPLSPEFPGRHFRKVESFCGALLDTAASELFAGLSAGARRPACAKATAWLGREETTLGRAN